MDESIKNNKEQTKSCFIEDTINCLKAQEEQIPSQFEYFAKNLFEIQEAMNGNSKEDYDVFSFKPEPHQEFYKGKTYTKEEIENIIKEDFKDCGSGQIGANPYKKDRAIDHGCPLLNNLNQLWCNIGEVFPDYKTANPDNLLKLLNEKLPRVDITWEAGKNIVVKGAVTNISHEDVKVAHDGLRKIVSDEAADKIIATIIANKIRKLF